MTNAIRKTAAPSQDNLRRRLDSLDQEDLIYILKNGLGVKHTAPDRAGNVELASRKIRSAAGHGLANLFRGGRELSYRKILIGVAAGLAPGIHPPVIWKRRFGRGLSEEELEQAVLDFFEDRARKWWIKLSDKKKEKIAAHIESEVNELMIRSAGRGKQVRKRITKELLESLLTKGIVAGLAGTSAGGMLGFLGGSMLTSIGWTVVVNTLGFMAGVKALLFGVSGVGLAAVGATVVGLAVVLPSAAVFAAAPNQKKTTIAVILLLSRVRLGKTFRRPGEPSAPEETKKENNAMGPTC